MESDARRVGQLNKGLSYIGDIPAADIAAAQRAGRFRATQDYAALHDRDVVFICVPVQLDKADVPNLQPLREAAEAIQAQLKPGQMIVLSSAIAAGSTQRWLRPILERGGLSAIADFDLAYVATREDAGRLDYAITNTPLVIGGVTQQASERGMRLLSGLGARVHLAPSPDVAEMSKLLESVFRTVNIALINEMALLCERLGLDIWEVINAAKSKSFGFMPFTPGPGVGGQHLPVHTELLTHTAREVDLHLPLIETATHINLGMPFHAVDLLERALSRIHLALQGAKIIVVGAAYKRDVEDTQDAPGKRIIELLIKRGAEVSYNDPYVSRLEVGGNAVLAEKRNLVSVNLNESILELSHGVIIVAGHHAVDYTTLIRYARVVVDCCNATEGLRGKATHVLRLGT